MKIRTTYRLGGPVGLAYAFKLAWIRWRLTQVRLYIDRERELHRANIRQLDAEIVSLVDAQQRTHVAAAVYWREVGQPAPDTREAR